MKAFAAGFVLAVLGLVAWLGRKPRDRPVSVIHWEGGGD